MGVANPRKGKRRSDLHLGRSELTRAVASCDERSQAEFCPDLPPKMIFPAVASTSPPEEPGRARSATV